MHIAGQLPSLQLALVQPLDSTASLRAFLSTSSKVDLLMLQHATKRKLCLSGRTSYRILTSPMYSNAYTQASMTMPSQPTNSWLREVHACLSLNLLEKTMKV